MSCVLGNNKSYLWQIKELSKDECCTGSRVSYRQSRCCWFFSPAQLDELSNAEDALSEANILNNTDPEVWAYLSLVCLKTGRQLEAEQAYKYAIKVCTTHIFVQSLSVHVCN